MAISLTTITIPTPQPYDAANPSRQRENYAYVWLQILDAAKQASESVSVNPGGLDLADLTQAVKDLLLNGYELSVPLPDGPELTLKFTSRSLSLVTT